MEYDYLGIYAISIAIIGLIATLYLFGSTWTDPDSEPSAKTASQKIALLIAVGWPALLFPLPIIWHFPCA